MDPILAEVEVQTTKEDISSFLKYFYFKRKQSAIRLAIVIWTSLMGFSHGVNVVINWPVLLLRVALLFAISSGVLFFIPYFIAVRKWKKRVAAGNFFLNIKVALKEDGFLITAAGKENFYRYDTIRIAENNKAFIFIVLLDSKLYLLPKRDFPGESDAVNFLALIKTKLGVVRAKKYLDNNKLTRLYNWGFLCIMPLVGGVTGLILLVRGIFEFKDRKLIAIGAAGLLWTIIIYASLFYELKNGAGSALGFSQITQSQLNSLAKEIEFYKLQYGTYPDSLKSVQKDEKFLSLYDPMLSRKSFGEKNRDYGYHYRKIGNKYTLFSVGNDGLPYTKDDIYPSLIINDTSKYGLIKVNGN